MVLEWERLMGLKSVCKLGTSLVKLMGGGMVLWVGFGVWNLLGSRRKSPGKRFTVLSTYDNTRGRITASGRTSVRLWKATTYVNNLRTCQMDFFDLLNSEPARADRL